MINRAVKSYLKTMYINAHKKRLHWIYFTMLIGALPLLIRLVVWLSVADSSIAPIVVGDVVFWGIMLNVAALYNISTAENMPDLQVSVTAAALVRLSLLVAIYTVALLPVMSPYVLWIAVTLLTSLSASSSFLTTDASYLEMQQKAYDLANQIQGLPMPIREKVRKNIKHLWDDNKFEEIQAEIAKCFAEYREQLEREIEQAS